MEFYLAIAANIRNAQVGSGPPFFRCLPLRRLAIRRGGGLIRRTVQHDEVGNLPSKGRLLASVSLSLVNILNRLGGRSSISLSPVPRDDNWKLCGLSGEPSNRRCAPRRTTIPTGFRDDDLRGRCFSTVFVCLRGTADLSAAIACYFAARRIAAQSRVHGGQAFWVEL